jgi:hypothetical protein
LLLLFAFVNFVWWVKVAAIPAHCLGLIVSIHVEGKDPGKHKGYICFVLNVPLEITTVMNMKAHKFSEKMTCE